MDEELITLITLKYGKPDMTRNYLESLPPEVIVRTYEKIYSSPPISNISTLIYRLRTWSIKHEDNIEVLTLTLIEHEQK